MQKDPNLLRLEILDRINSDPTLRYIFVSSIEGMKIFAKNRAKLEGSSRFQEKTEEFKKLLDRYVEIYNSPQTFTNS